MPASRRAAPITKTGEAGFTIVESLIALGLIFGVIVGLMGAVTTGVRGIVTGRQRSVALSIANEVMETARSRSYADVGHDLDSDPTLVTDTAGLRETAPYVFYTEPSVGPAEPLVGSVVDAGVNAGDASADTNPLFPFSPHQWPTVREATTYTASVYVTEVVRAPDDPPGDPYRRLTVIVTWDRSLNAASAVPASVRLSSFLFDAVQPPDPLFVGLAEADAGTFSVVPRSPSDAVSDVRLWLPSTHGEIDSRFVRRATGFAGTARSVTNMRSGPVPVCSVGGASAECPGVKVETGSDNDAATAPLDHNAIGPTSDPGGTLAAGSTLASILGSGTARSLSTARSCWACYGVGVDDDDLLPFQWAQATGPASLSMPFSFGPTTGSLLTTGAACPACSTVTLDRDDVSTNSRLLTKAEVAHPSIDIATFDGAPADYAGMVRIGPTNVATSATSGPGALEPTFTGSAVSVQVYDTTIPGYRTLTITPGTPSEATSHADMVINGANVAVDATVRSGPAVTLWTPDPATGAMLESQASLSNWLTIDVHLLITDSLGAILADLDLSLDYGRVTTRATYEPAPA